MARFGEHPGKIGLQVVSPLVFPGHSLRRRAAVRSPLRSLFLPSISAAILVDASGYSVDDAKGPIMDPARVTNFNFQPPLHPNSHAKFVTGQFVGKSMY